MALNVLKVQFSSQWCPYRRLLTLDSLSPCPIQVRRGPACKISLPYVILFLSLLLEHGKMTLSYLVDLSLLLHLITFVHIPVFLYNLGVVLLPEFTLLVHIGQWAVGDSFHDWITGSSGAARYQSQWLAVHTGTVTFISSFVVGSGINLLITYWAGSTVTHCD